MVIKNIKNKDLVNIERLEEVTEKTFKLFAKENLTFFEISLVLMEALKQNKEGIKDLYKEVLK